MVEAIATVTPEQARALAEKPYFDEITAVLAIKLRNQGKQISISALRQRVAKLIEEQLQQLDKPATILPINRFLEEQGLIRAA